MKLTALSAFIFVFALLFCSCQKDIPDYVNGAGDSTSNNSNSPMVKTYTEDLYPVNAPDQHVRDSFALSYDNKGRLVSMIQLDSANGLQLRYQYNNDNSITLDQYDNGSVQTHEIVYLNSFSFTDSTYQYNNEGDTFTEKYTYDANRRLIQMNSYDYSTTNGSSLSETDTYTYDNDNDVIREVDNYLNPPGDSNIITSSYANHVLNNLNIGLNYQNQSKYLPDVVTGLAGGETQIATHVYTFDNKNRLTMDKATLSNGYVAIKRYYY